MNIQDLEIYYFCTPDIDTIREKYFKTFKELVGVENFFNNAELNDEARKRLKTIKEFSELGSGYRIAMRDLSIRGAGDILGSEQSGFIDSVGIDMYLQILKETIEEKKIENPLTREQIELLVKTFDEPELEEELRLLDKQEKIIIPPNP